MVEIAVAVIDHLKRTTRPQCALQVAPARGNRAPCQSGPPCVLQLILHCAARARNDSSIMRCPCLTQDWRIGEPAKQGASITFCRVRASRASANNNASATAAIVFATINLIREPWSAARFRQGQHAPGGPIAPSSSRRCIEGVRFAARHGSRALASDCGLAGRLTPAHRDSEKPRSALSRGLFSTDVSTGIETHHDYRCARKPMAGPGRHCRERTTASQVGPSPQHADEHVRALCGGLRACRRLQPPFSAKRGSLLLRTISRPRTPIPGRQQITRHRLAHQASPQKMQSPRSSMRQPR